MRALVRSSVDSNTFHVERGASPPRPSQDSSPTTRPALAFRLITLQPPPADSCSQPRTTVTHSLTAKSGRRCRYVAGGHARTRQVTSVSRETLKSESVSCNSQVGDVGASRATATGVGRPPDKSRVWVLQLNLLRPVQNRRASSFGLQRGAWLVSTPADDRSLYSNWWRPQVPDNAMTPRRG